MSVSEFTRSWKVGLAHPGLTGLLTLASTKPAKKRAQDTVNRIRFQLQQACVELATALAWYYLVERISGNLAVQSTLISWKQTIKRIGKGTGKNSSILRKQAQELMAASQQAVPAWIMPLGKVMHGIDPSKT